MLHLYDLSSWYDGLVRSLEIATLAIVEKSVFLTVTLCHAKKLGWRWAFVSQHQVEGPSKVVGQRAAVGLLCQGQEEGQEQEEQEEQLQW